MRPIDGGRSCVAGGRLGEDGPVLRIEVGKQVPVYNGAEDIHQADLFSILLLLLRESELRVGQRPPGRSPGAPDWAVLECRDVGVVGVEHSGCVDELLGVYWEFVEELEGLVFCWCWCLWIEGRRMRRMFCWVVGIIRTGVCPWDVGGM